MFFFGGIKRCLHGVKKARLLVLHILPKRVNLWPFLPRKRVIACFLLVAAVSWLLISTSHRSVQLYYEQKYAEEEKRFNHLNDQLEYLRSLYLAREQDVYQVKNKFLFSNESDLQQSFSRKPRKPRPTYSPEVEEFLEECTGMMLKNGLDPHNLDLVHTPFVYQLLPHLQKDPDSLRPAYHLKTERRFVNVVIGIPTVKRDKESYLTVTLFHLVNKLDKKQMESTIIIVFVGETDLKFVLETARKIETLFPEEIERGLIEVMSPSPSFYPDLDSMPATLGDSQKRFKWRTKQNLDTMYLMAYAHSKGTYYLMLEDDVVAKTDYMTSMMEFTYTMALKSQNWVFIEFCPNGGIGKLFRSTDLFRFLTYVQLFYTNQPVDWLLDSYLVDKICTNEKNGSECKKNVRKLKPAYITSLFYHIGLYSSLKGKTHKESVLGTLPSFYKHENPPLGKIVTDINTFKDHSIHNAYQGKTYYWGTDAKAGSVIELWFAKPTVIEKYTFRSGNREYPNDLIKDAVVEVATEAIEIFTEIGEFDEFGFAEGKIAPKYGPLIAIRVRFTKPATHWILISEIELRAKQDNDHSSNPSLPQQPKYTSITSTKR